MTVETGLKTRKSRSRGGLGYLGKQSDEKDGRGPLDK